MNAISQYQFGNHPVRIVMRGEEPWFVATDICAALDYKNTSKAVADHLDDDERSNEQLDRSRMGSKAVIINESGLYALVLRSRKPEARKFAKWVTGEVLPSIRKTGRYSMQPDLIDASRHETLNELVARLARQLAEPNGYCVQTFMPLYEEICKQLGKKAQRAPSVKQPGFYKALEASNALASAVQIAAMQALMEGGQLKAGRWAMNINEHEGMGRGVHVKPMPLNAIMAAPEDWPRLITEPNGNYFSKETLTLIMNACLNKLLDYLDCTQQSNEMLRTELKRRKALPA